MAYVPQFKNDIFISYRHASNEGPDRWVEVFCDRLRVRLRELVGDIAIWRDKAEIRASDVWRVEIAEALDTAVFLAIISKTYLDSDVCRTELDQFLGRMKRAAQAAEATRPRMFSVLKQPPEPNQPAPPELAEFQHVEFFQLEAPGSRRFQEFSPGQDEETQRQFWKTLERLAQDLMDALRDLKGDARRHAVGTVFLADVNPELRAQRENLRSDLQQRGFLVVPERRYMWYAGDLNERIAKDLEAAQLCVHQVSRAASSEAESAARSKLQLELATEAMKGQRKPPPLVWIQPGAEIEEPARELIAFVESKLSNDGVEYWHGSLEEFKTHIYDRLSSPAPADKDPLPSRDVALLVEDHDLAAAEEINDFIADELGLEVRRIKFSGSSPRKPESFERVLAGCGKCILFLGTQSLGWVNEVLKISALARYDNRERLCVYGALPESAEKSGLDPNRGRLIEASPTCQAELREFLAPIGAGR